MIIEMLTIEIHNPYKVKKGQTAGRLAKELSTTVYAIIAKNGLTEELHEGQILFLPPKGNVYTVQAGDTKTLLCGGEREYEKCNGTNIFYPGMRVLLSP